MTELGDFYYVEECLRGHPNAFEPLIDKYQKPIFNAALRMLNNYEDAQDVTQSVFVKAFEKLDSFNPKYKFYSSKIYATGILDFAYFLTLTTSNLSSWSKIVIH